MKISNWRVSYHTLDNPLDVKTIDVYANDSQSALHSVEYSMRENNNLAVKSIKAEQI